MPVQLASNPKRVRIFIKDGKKYEGGIEEYHNSKNDLGGITIPDRLPEQTKGEEEVKN